MEKAKYLKGLSVSGNSETMHCGILISMPFCLLAKVHTVENKTARRFFCKCLVFRNTASYPVTVYKMAQIPQSPNVMYVVDGHKIQNAFGNKFVLVLFGLSIIFLLF